MTTGDTEVSRQAAIEAVKFRPNDFKARTLLARHHLIKGEFEKAGREAAIALKIKPDYFQAAFIMGKSLLFSKKYDKALVIFNKLHSMLPDNIEVLQNMGITQLAVEKKDAALKAFEKALELEPAYSPALSYTAAIHADVKDIQSAIDRVKQQILISPDTVGHQMVLGDLLLVHSCNYWLWLLQYLLNRTYYRFKKFIIQSAPGFNMLLLPCDFPEVLHPGKEQHQYTTSCPFCHRTCRNLAGCFHHWFQQADY